MPNTSFKKLLHQNLLALISLAVAIAALSYNSWRNEVSEDNRNHREAGFEILRESAHLQLLVDRATYGSQEQKPDPIQGWVRVNLILSFTQLNMPKVNDSAKDLKQVWQDNWEQVFSDEQANKEISNAIDRLNQSVLAHLASLK